MAGDKLSFDLQYKKGILVCAAKGNFDIPVMQSILDCPTMFPKNGTFIIKTDSNTVYSKIVPGLQELGEVTWKNIPVRRVASVRRFSLGFVKNKSLIQMVLKTSDKIKLKEAIEFLKKYEKTDDSFALYDGVLYEVDPGAMESYQQLINLSENQTIGDDDSAKIDIPLQNAIAVSNILHAHADEKENFIFEVSEDVERLIKDVSTPFQNEYVQPESLQAKLYPYQEDGYKWLCTLQHYNLGCILADDMGLGKTLQTISMVLHAFEDGVEKPALIVCPSSLTFNWENEFKKFAPSLKVQVMAGEASSRQKKISDENNGIQVFVTSYNTLHSDFEYYKTRGLSILIADEAQYIKNPETQNATCLKSLRADFRLALTGTPIENKLLDLWSIFDYILPGFLGTKSDFNGVYNNSASSDTLKKLHNKILPFILRRLKKDVLKDLPEKTEELLYIRMDDEQQKIYSSEVAKLRAIIEKKTDEELAKERLFVLSELTKLRQICCAPELVLDFFTGENAKLNATFDLLENAIAGGHKVLVFSQFTKMLGLLTAKFDEQNIKYHLLTGETTALKRSEMVRSFDKDDVPVFCISLKAGGTGLTLTAADIVIHYDPWWNVSAENQASDRAYRIGQKNPVTVYKMICKDAIEEQILNIQQKKIKLSEAMLSGEQISDTKLTREDLLGLLE